MSWQAYVNDHLLGTGKVTHAAIIGQAGGVWASSAGFKLTSDEEKAIVAAHAKPNDVLASGLRIAGVKYFGISADGRTIQLKKGPDGGVVVKTKQAIIVALYVAPVQSAETVTVVEKLADYLIGVGY